MEPAMASAGGHWARIGIGGEPQGGLAPSLVVIHHRRTRLATFLFGVVANGLQRQGRARFLHLFFFGKPKKPSGLPGKF
jgi:hypothetical protein